MSDQENEMQTPRINYVFYNDLITIDQNIGGYIGHFTSPIISHIQSSQAFENQERINKTLWVCDYSDDIFQTLRESELSRRLVCFRSQQICQRPVLLKFLKNAAEKNKLLRTTVHLAVYLLDCFMDNYIIREDKLSLCAITCLMVAAKIEEADIDMPKFSDLNKLSNVVYTLKEFKSFECKVLEAFNFDLIRPTTATFAEYFANRIITLQDYHIFINRWNNEMIVNYYHEQQQDLQTNATYGEEVVNDSYLVFSTPCPYTSYENMLTILSKAFFDLIDISLNYLKFGNVRPSVMTSACIAASRQIHGIFPIWTPYLIKLTHCTADIISPFVKDILEIYWMHHNNENLQPTPNTPLSPESPPPVLCGSPDSGIVLAYDTKSTISEADNADDSELSLNLDASNTVYYVPIDTDDEERAYRCLGYLAQAKKRRLF